MTKPWVMLRMMKGYQAQLVPASSAMKPNTQVSPVTENTAELTRKYWVFCFLSNFELERAAVQRYVVTTTNNIMFISREITNGMMNETMADSKWLIQQLPWRPFSNTPYWTRFSVVKLTITEIAVMKSSIVRSPIQYGM